MVEFRTDESGSETDRTGGVTIPTDMIDLIASSMVKWEGITFSLSRKRRNPEGGTKVVGTNTVSLFS